MLTGVLAGLAAGALWGLVFVAPRMASGFASVDLAAGRFLAYGAVALGMQLWGLRTRRWPDWQQALAALLLSVPGFTGYYLLVVLAIRDAGTQMPALIIGTIPVWVMLLGRSQGLRWAALAPGLLLTVAGLALMASTPQGGEAARATVSLAPTANTASTASLAGTAGAVYWRGIALAVGAMLCWTAFAILNAAWLRRHPTVSATDWANWLGVATGLGGLLLWLVGDSSAAHIAVEPGLVGFVLLCIMLGLGPSWLATVLWNHASQKLSASLCGQLIVSETLFALLYSFFWDGHWPAPAQSVAAALFTAGILASTRAHR